MVDSSLLWLILPTIIILVPIFIAMFMDMNGYSINDIKKKLTPIFSNNKKVVITVIVVVLAITILFGIISSANKQGAINEIKDDVESSVNNVYIGYEYTLENIDVSVNDIDNYLGEYHASVVINCEVSKVNSDDDEEAIARKMMNSLPKSVETSAYGDVSVANILYRPDNDTHGVAIYVNGNQYYKHGKTFEQLAKENQIKADRNNYDEYDEIMAGQDWGDDYYYDSSDHEVKKKPW